MNSIEILVVIGEDSESDQLRESLASLGFQQARFTDSLEEASAVFHQHASQIVFADLGLELGPKDIIEFAAGLKQIRDVPVIYLSGLADPETLGRARETGPFACLIKPVAAPELHDLMTRLGALSDWEEPTELPSSGSTPAVDARFVGSYSRSDAVILTDLTGQITFINNLAEEITGWSNAEAVGRPYVEVFCLTDEKGDRKSHRPFPRSFGTSPEGPTFLKLRNGTRVPISDKSTSLTDRNGSLTGLAV
ncbi:MAG: PAS domain-containing protein, partial [Verrucomicrobiota bacterium]